MKQWHGLAFNALHTIDVEPAVPVLPRKPRKTSKQGANHHYTHAGDKILWACSRTRPPTVQDIAERWPDDSRATHYRDLPLLLHWYNTYTITRKDQSA